jgi:class 3 adenylate cyclase
MFGAPATQPDHVRRSCAAARALVAAAEAAAAPGWPRFRVGGSTGPAIVGNVGRDALRSYTAIGDTVNIAARLESVAPVGGICISEATPAELGSDAPTEPRGEVAVKGRADPVVAHLLY